MDLSNFINNEKQQQIKNQFNAPQLNFQQNQQNIINFEDNNYAQKEQLIKENNTKESLLKDLFTLLANYNDAGYIVRTLKSKYGNLVDDKVIAACFKLSQVMGNYLITCKYNDDLGHKNPLLVKYVLFCDCQDQQPNEIQVNKGGNIDGFFDQDKKFNIFKKKICKKHNLPVLAKIQDLTQQDFNQLAKKIAQIKCIPQVKQEDLKSKGNVISKISKIFRNANVKKYKKQDNSKYTLKQANVDLVATVGKKMNVANINDVQVPKQVTATVAKKIQNSKVNIPTNKIDVKLNKHAKSIKPFSVKIKNYDDLKINANLNDDIKISGKDISVSVQKQAKYVQNICVKTESLDPQFDLKDSLSVDIQQNKLDDLTVDPRNNFDF